MSYMGQDFIANHMKSHYRRIVSAKASVDTSPPKSMKKHIKVRDQKKRAALESRAGTPSSLRQQSPSLDFLSSSRNEAPLNSTFNGPSPGRRQATGTPLPRSLSTQSLDRHYPPTAPSPSPREMLTRDHSTPASARLSNSKPPVSPIAKKPLQNATGRGQYKSTLGRNQITLQTLDNAEPSALYNVNGNVYTLLSSYDDQPFGDVQKSLTLDTSGDERFTRTDADQNRQSHRRDVPHLDLSNVQYSHRGPPSLRTNDSTDFKANIWDEEQQYLKFISDVTSDILARGIFSNRVLRQVFEMHIDRRKDYLDESRLREMIEQLKEDLGITDS